MRSPKWFLKRNMVSRALWPVGQVYNLASKIHFIYRLFGRKKSKKPVICIGNILAGGVGKTPVVREVARGLPRPAIMSRFADEAGMLCRQFNVYAGKDRKANLAVMQKNNRINHIIMDDGFQDSGIKKDVSILVFDGAIGLGNGFILPAGPLRETLRSGLRRADAVVIIGEDRTGLESKILRIRKIPVFFAERKFKKTKFGRKLIAFSGIGYPDKFFKSLEEVSGKKIAEKFPFPDHHDFTEIELQKLASMRGQIWTTEKDFHRLPGWFARRVKVLKMSIEIEKGFYKWLRSKIKS